MANTQAMSTSFMGKLMTGTHNFGTGVIRAGTGADTYYGRLHTQASGPRATMPLVAAPLPRVLTPEVLGAAYG